MFGVGCARPWYQSLPRPLLKTKRAFCSLLNIYSMSKSDINYHPNFNKYVEMIVSHPNYEGLFYDRSSEGKINWVVTGKSEKGRIRQAWWDKKCKELGIPIQKGCYAEAARRIHPTKIHVCQNCGKPMSILYEYPGARLLKSLNSLFGTTFSQIDYTIREIVEKYCNDRTKLNAVAKLLKLNCPLNKESLIHDIYTIHVYTCSSYFSPGVMSNPPDRFDGFHSYGLCCRKTKDTGRHDENMMTYTQDRRAYEEWSDGDYNLANRLMGEFHKQPPMQCPKCGELKTMTADHIGPISLGFCHSKHFSPMCRNCNSAKNNRFTKDDVDILLSLEKKGEQVVSWHSKYIWDLLKNCIENDVDAKIASSIMAKCHQNVLYIFSIIYHKTGMDFLKRYLHPEYSMFDYRFSNVDLSNLNNIIIHRTPLDSKNKRKNQERYIRIAFESLESFGNKENRKVSYVISEKSIQLKKIINLVKAYRYDEADIELNILIQRISTYLAKLGWAKSPAEEIRLSKQYGSYEDFYKGLAAESKLDF